jgi:Uma2 family endonuclease
MAINPEHKMHPAEYLVFERAQTDAKHEYLDGEITAMGGASLQHNLIAVNVLTALRTQMRGRLCDVFSGDMRVKVSATGLYTYPDISALCGERQLEDDAFDTLLNPCVIIEILSPSTEAYDRGVKFAHYQSIESLQVYALIAQDKCRIEIYRRQERESWLYSAVEGLDAGVNLDVIGCELSVADVYEGVIEPEDRG